MPFTFSFNIFANMYVVKQRLLLLKEKRWQTSRDMLIVLSDISGQARLSSREDRSLHGGAALFLRIIPGGVERPDPAETFPESPG